MSIPAPKPAPAVLPRPTVRLPHWGWFLLAVVLLVATYLTVGAWILNLWAMRTIDRFLQHARDGDMTSCRRMLAEDRNDGNPENYLNEGDLGVAAKESLRVEKRSFVDYVRGRQRFRVDLAAFNDHSFTVERGRVTLGGSYWMYYPPGPDFTLKTRLQATDDETLPEPVELDVEEDP